MCIYLLVDLCVFLCCLLVLSFCVCMVNLWDVCVCVFVYLSILDRGSRYHSAYVEVRTCMDVLASYVSTLHRLVF